MNLEVIISQYPIALNIAMTIHKSQGQTLNSISIHLEEDLKYFKLDSATIYVAFSRIREKKDLKLICSKYFGFEKLIELFDFSTSKDLKLFMKDFIDIRIFDKYLEDIEKKKIRYLVEFL